MVHVLIISGVIAWVAVASILGCLLGRVIRRRDAQQDNPHEEVDDDGR